MKGVIELLVIVGESGAGKSSVAKALEKYGYQPVVTYTTRQKRIGEVDGVDYHFISQEDFNKIEKENYMVAKGLYRGWNYGMDIRDLFDNSVVVLTPSGLRELQRRATELPKFKSVYIYVSRRDRLIKLLERGDDIEEAYRRNLSDVGQFDGIQHEVDICVTNIGYQQNVDELAETIKMLI